MINQTSSKNSPLSAETNASDYSQISKSNQIELIDYLILILNKKKILVLIFFFSFILSYGYVRFFVEKQYDASATIIPNGQNSLAGMASLVKNISNVLPVGLGNISKESEMDLYNTIIYSRTSMENLINKFDLQRLYKIKQKENVVKLVRQAIVTNVTMENAYVIKVRSKTPQLACDITNYLVNYLNDEIIKLNVSKSKENRLFLEKRYNEIKFNLQKAEDSLKNYQEKVGLLDADNQVKTSIEAFSKLESELAQKQIEVNVLNKIYGIDAPNVNSAKISLLEFQKKLNTLKKGTDKSITFVGLDSLPQKALDFYRYYRDVKISEQMLEYLLPLYEQSKFEEQKDVPILQVIDYAVPPEKKSSPQRALISGIVGLFAVFFAVSLLLSKHYLEITNNQKILKLRKELLNF